MDEILRAAVTLFIVIDPIGIVPIFLSVTRHQEQGLRRATALRSVLIGTAILLAFVVGGQLLLQGMHISLPAFQIAGGLILFLIGLTMLFDLDFKGASANPEEPPDVAVFPLAIPMIAGPGAIMAVVVLTDKNRFNFVEQTLTTLVLLGVLGLTYLLLLGATWILRWIGAQGIHIVSRVLGLLLCALAVETTLGGVREFWRQP